jgi:hypothetical protein
VDIILTDWKHKAMEDPAQEMGNQEENPRKRVQVNSENQKKA